MPFRFTFIDRPTTTLQKILGLALFLALLWPMTVTYGWVFAHVASLLTSKPTVWLAQQSAFWEAARHYARIGTHGGILTLCLSGSLMGLAIVGRWAFKKR